MIRFDVKGDETVVGQNEKKERTRTCPGRKQQEKFPKSDLVLFPIQNARLELCKVQKVLYSLIRKARKGEQRSEYGLYRIYPMYTTQFRIVQFPDRRRIIDFIIITIIRTGI